MAENATDTEIQSALHQLFKTGPQGPANSSDSPSNQDQSAPQGRSILKYPQGTNSVQDSSPSNVSTNAIVIASTGISKIQLDTTIKNSIASALQSEAPYSQILKELEGGARQTILNNLIFKRMNSLLVVHDQKQDDNLDF